MQPGKKRACLESRNVAFSGARNEQFPLPPFVLRALVHGVETAEAKQSWRSSGGEVRRWSESCGN